MRSPSANPSRFALVIRNACLRSRPAERVDIGLRGGREDFLSTDPRV
jgi:hypothetical protein